MRDKEAAGQVCGRGGGWLAHGASRGLLCSALCAATVMVVVEVVGGRTTNRPHTELGRVWHAKRAGSFSLVQFYNLY